MTVYLIFEYNLDHRGVMLSQPQSQYANALAIAQAAAVRLNTPTLTIGEPPIYIQVPVDPSPSTEHPGYRVCARWNGIIGSIQIEEWEAAFVEDAQGNRIDPTADQFPEGPPYHLARGCGFLTNKPSKRARIVLERIAP